MAKAEIPGAAEFLRKYQTTLAEMFDAYSANLRRADRVMERFCREAGETMKARRLERTGEQLELLRRNVDWMTAEEVDAALRRIIGEIQDTAETEVRGPMPAVRSGRVIRAGDVLYARDGQRVIVHQPHTGGTAVSLEIKRPDRAGGDPAPVRDGEPVYLDEGYDRIGGTDGDGKSDGDAQSSA